MNHYFNFPFNNSTSFYVFCRAFLFRWNQLTVKKKNKLTTFLVFKNNLSKILEAINLGVRNFVKSSDIFKFDSNNEKKSLKSG